MKKTVLVALCASSLGLGACELEVPDLNNPSLESLRETPTPSGVYAASTGLLIGSRAGKAAQNGYVAHLGILGRESYTFDAADPRFVTEMLASPSLDPGSPAFGGNLWAQPYANIGNANTVLAALDKVSGVEARDKEAIRGFAKTMQALDFLMVAVTRDTNGGPIDVADGISRLGKIETKETLLAHVSTLLDESKAHLEAAGTQFPFPLSSGFTGYNTPATFVKFNRAVKARTEVYRQNWTEALQALSESFLDTTKPLTEGVYYAYGTGSGDATNGLTSPNLFAHPSLVTDALADPGRQKASCTPDTAQPFKCLDDRISRKIKETDSRTYQGLTSKYMFRMYESNSAPVPVIRNEDLILLRAEAHIQLGNFPPAEEDINFVRERSGGLPPVTLVGENAVDILLEERRYSLLFEGGHRWIDMRRYNRLSLLPKDKPEHVIHERFPIPVAETDARQ
jgi:starch-binding outer membrane protein, SusD/RagB family